jgi:PhzF family phenazine biosynthesis protein
MQLPRYQIDAVTSRPFAGNPAAVCPLASWLDPAVMQAIAAENNLSETAFFVRRGECYDLRWFTPTCEVDLCGHATLASAFVIFEYLDRAADTVGFETASGPLIVRRAGGLLTMDFPARPPKPAQANPALAAALGRPYRELLESRDYFAVYDTEEEVRALRPNFQALAAVGHFAVIVTAPAAVGGVDFVSRFFAPATGIDEDPVTGSAHSTLVPYWSQRLNKTSLHALQVSARGGELWLEDRGKRVSISGHAVAYLDGAIRV